MARGVNGLPVRTFVELAVAGQDDHAVRGLLLPARERHADRDRKPVAQGARGDLDLRAVLAVRVHTELRAFEALEVIDHVVQIIRAQARKDGIQRLRAVALRKDETVAALFMGILHVEVQVSVIPGRRHFDHGELSAEVAHADVVHERQKRLSYVIGRFFQLMHGSHIIRLDFHKLLLLF